MLLALSVSIRVSSFSRSRYSIASSAVFVMSFGSMMKSPHSFADIDPRLRTAS